MNHINQLNPVSMKKATQGGSFNFRTDDVNPEGLTQFFDTGFPTTEFPQVIEFRTANAALTNHADAG